MGEEVGRKASLTIMDIFSALKDWFESSVSAAQCLGQIVLCASLLDCFLREECNKLWSSANSNLELLLHRITASICVHHHVSLLSII